MTISAGVCAQLACVWEATARKPGNVHRLCDFADTTYVDFLMSAAAIGPPLEAARAAGVGATVLAAVRATRSVTRGNTNLGIVLLLAPLAAVPDGEPLQPGVRRVLAGLTVSDARQVYEAIRLAAPGGLGRASDQDVAGEPTLGLREAMALAADRDLVALQYADGFAEVFDQGLPALRDGLARAGCLEGAIVYCQLGLLAALPDSLIVRKRGAAEGAEASRQARSVLEAGWPGPEGRAALDGLDAWLRAEGNRRNPGTTADLVTATLFAAVREGVIGLPLAVPWSLPGLLP